MGKSFLTEKDEMRAIYSQLKMSWWPTNPVKVSHRTILEIQSNIEYIFFIWIELNWFFSPVERNILKKMRLKIECFIYCLTMEKNCEGVFNGSD